MKQASSADRVFPGYGQSRKATPSRAPHPEATGKSSREGRGPVEACGHTRGTALVARSSGARELVTWSVPPAGRVGLPDHRGHQR